MNKILLAFAIGFPALVATEKKNPTPLHDFQNTIIEAQTAPFLYMPWYALKCNNLYKQRPNATTRIAWCNKIYKKSSSSNNSEINQITKKEVIQKASEELAKRNSLSSVIKDTLALSVIGFVFNFAGQCAYAKFTGNPISLQNINTKGLGFTTGLGTAYSLACHQSMSSMQKQANKIIDYASQD